VAEEQQLPEWLADLSGQQLEESHPEEPHLEEPRPEEPHLEEGPQEDTREASFGRLMESLREQPPTQPDMVGDLREQIVQSEDDFDKDPEPSGILPGMKPWQGCVLAFLLLLNVAVLGCMALLVTGRVILPF